MSQGGSGKRIGGSLLALMGALLLVVGGAILLSFDSSTGASRMPVLSVALIGAVLLVVGVRLVLSGERAFQAVPTSPPAQATASNPIGALVGLLMIGGFGWYYFGGGLEQQADRSLDQIKDKVAADAVVQYGIAKRNGTAMDACVQAGLVAASYLQAQNEVSYQEWKQIEKADCARAGLPR